MDDDELLLVDEELEVDELEDDELEDEEFEPEELPVTSELELPPQAARDINMAKGTICLISMEGLGCGLMGNYSLALFAAINLRHRQQQALRSLSLAEANISEYGHTFEK